VTETDFGLGSEHYIDPIFIGPGVHYLVGFSFGSDEYASDVYFSSASCILVSPASTLVQKDQTDFTAPGGSLPASGQIYVLGRGSETI